MEYSLGIFLIMLGSAAAFIGFITFLVGMCSEGQREFLWGGPVAVIGIVVLSGGVNLAHLSRGKAHFRLEYNEDGTRDWKLVDGPSPTTEPTR